MLCAWVLASCLHLAARTFEVGPDRDYTAITQVPWESIAPGDTVRIHWRPQPYAEKWGVCGAGTPDAPITVIGVAGPDGQLPVIDAANAISRTEMPFPGEDRAVIKIGGTQANPDAMPSHVVVENLEVRGATPGRTFLGSSGRAPYRDHAAAIWIEAGEHITVRNCVLHDCGNGLFASHRSSAVVVEHCRIHGNGTELGIHHHNVYTESQGIIFQFNHFGPLRRDAFGNNLKDRSAGTVVRYNWIEGGSRLLDLVDSDYPHIRSRPDYRETFVYGNVLVKLADTTNRQVIHYGGDSDVVDRYRNGTVFVVNNTVVSRRSGTVDLLMLSTPKDVAVVRNNILWCSSRVGHLRPMSSPGTAYLGWNWCPRGFEAMLRFMGEEEGVRVEGQHLFGDDPGFRDAGSGDYRLIPGSPCVGAAGPLPDAMLREHTPTAEYMAHRQARLRDPRKPLDLGALTCE